MVCVLTHILQSTNTITHKWKTKKASAKINLRRFFTKQAFFLPTKRWTRNLFDGNQDRFDHFSSKKTLRLGPDLVQPANITKTCRPDSPWRSESICGAYHIWTLLPLFFFRARCDIPRTHLDMVTTYMKEVPPRRRPSYLY